MAKTYGQATGRESMGRQGGKGKPMPGGAATSIKRVSYREVDTTKLVQLLEVCTHSGGAVLFGITSDGGAFALTFFAGNDRKKVYAPDVEALEAILEEWSDYYRD